MKISEVMPRGTALLIINVFGTHKILEAVGREYLFCSLCLYRATGGPFEGVLYAVVDKGAGNVCYENGKLLRQCPFREAP